MKLMLNYGIKVLFIKLFNNIIFLNLKKIYLIVINFKYFNGKISTLMDYKYENNLLIAWFCNSFYHR